jgi:hypothetical protein
MSLRRTSRRFLAWTCSRVRELSPDCEPPGSGHHRLPCTGRGRHRGPFRSRSSSPFRSAAGCRREQESWWSHGVSSGSEFLRGWWAGRRRAAAGPDGAGWPECHGRGDPLRAQPGGGHRGADRISGGGLVQPKAGFLRRDRDRAQEADRGPRLAGLCPRPGRCRRRAARRCPAPHRGCRSRPRTGACGPP